MTNVYVVGPENGPYKIGVADNLKNRIAILQTSAPSKIRLHHSRKCDDREKAYAVEFNSHRLLTQYRSFGEWFTCDLSDAVKTVDNAPTQKIIIERLRRDPSATPIRFSEMDAAEYLDAIARVELEPAQVAELFGYTRQIHYSKWKKDGPPRAVAYWLRYMVRTGFTPDQFKELGN